ncbi:MAG: tRNA (N6-isopentenyl adenosine(37)-C2)-methylthiotransferase MiaB [Dehalococcoidia bacterium]|nr:tRNA (N6-isopentenyl adenosine(37)-C2)-methylthiotransferase MiaB [Dehalococcoidia bacterium]
MGRSFSWGDGMKRYFLWTVGCQMNAADSAKLAAGLAKLGYQPVEDPAEADVAVLNTCAVRQGAEDRAYGQLGRLRRIKQERGDGFRIALMGCMVGLRTTELEKRFPFVDVFARPQAFDDVIVALGEEPADLGGEFWPDAIGEARGPTAFVPVVHGCDKFCTYCIVPYRRGRERSRTIDDVEHEVRVLASRGVREVTLLGQTVEAYGHDLPERPDLGDLMAELSAIDGIERIRFLTSYPKDMTDRIIASVAALPKVCEYFSVPVQSGDDAVLTSMRRGYTVSEFRDRIARIRLEMPEAGITTDVIVGYPGETDAQFRNSLGLLEELRFDKVHVAMYSPRPGTIAWRTMEDDVPAEVKHARLQAVEALEQGIAASINDALVGRTLPVLVESVGDEGTRTGRTRSGKLVHFTSAAALGDTPEVRIEKASAWSLKGIVANPALLG